MKAPAHTDRAARAGGEYHPPPNASNDPRVSQLRQIIGLEPRPGVTYPPNATEPWMVGRRVDALVVAYRLDMERLSPNVEDRGRLAAAVGPVELEFGGAAFQLRSDSRGSFVHFENADLRGTLNWHATGGWHLELVPRAVFLATHTLTTALRLCDRCAEMFGPVLEGPRLRRVDLAADFMQFALDPSDAARLATMRAGVTEFAAETKDVDEVRTGPNGMALQTHLNPALRVTGFSISSGNPISARIYDKTAELRCPGREEKRAIEHGIWERRGWSGQGPVVRVEFQMRGEFLDEVSLRDARELPSKLDELWQYGVRWLRLIDPSSASRRSPCKLDPRWEAVTTVVFEHAASPVPRGRKRGGASARHTLGTVLSHQGSIGALERIDTGHDRDGVVLNEQELVQRMSDREVLGFVRAQVGRVFAEAANDVAESLIAENGLRRTAVLVAARVNATRARFSSIDDAKRTR